MSESAKSDGIRGRGCLSGRMHCAADWDSPEVNERIAADFDIAPAPTGAAPGTIAHRGLWQIVPRPAD